jgi:hypothetical protein
MILTGAWWPLCNVADPISNEMLNVPRLIPLIFSQVDNDLTKFSYSVKIRRLNDAMFQGITKGSRRGKSPI